MARSAPAVLKPLAPKALPGFEGVARYYDAAERKHVAQVLPGEYYVTCSEEIVSTVLGSCVAACMRDPNSSFAGVNHFMLPQQGETGDPGQATRYGLYAMERLINELLKWGARRDDLEVKIFGGGKVISGMGDVGRANIEFVRTFLQEEGFHVHAEDLGGPWARRIRYYPLTGRVLVKRMAMGEAQQVVQQEVRLKESLRPMAGSVELFGDD